MQTNLSSSSALTSNVISTLSVGVIGLGAMGKGMAQDLGLVLDLARSSKFPLPLSATAHQMFMQASTAGYAKEDDSAVIKIFPGITLPSLNKADES